MPLYDYECMTCGEFREWRKMSEWEASVPCPNCSLPAPRRAAAPMLAVLSTNNRIAHEPKVLRRQDLSPHHRHHGHRHEVNPLLKQQFGEVHRSPPDRPWMVGH